MKDLWRRFCDNVLPWLLLLAVIAIISLPGCAAWYEPSPELDYWKCIEVNGSYVKCEHLEMVR